MDVIICFSVYMQGLCPGLLKNELNLPMESTATPGFGLDLGDGGPRSQPWHLLKLRIVFFRGSENPCLMERFIYSIFQVYLIIYIYIDIDTCVYVYTCVCVYVWVSRSTCFFSRGDQRFARILTSVLSKSLQHKTFTNTILKTHHEGNFIQYIMWKG